jgi:hypothetical protein
VRKKAKKRRRKKQRKGSGQMKKKGKWMSSRTTLNSLFHLRVFFFCITKSLGL